MQTRTSLTLLLVGLTAAMVATVLVLLERESPAEPDSFRGTAVMTAGRDGGGRDASESVSDTRPAGAMELGRADPVGAALPSTSVPSAAELVTVTVVRADTLEPVPDAQVWQWRGPPAFGGDGMAAWLHRGEVEEHTPSAAAAHSDQQGRVLVPKVEEGFWVVASAGDLWGYAAFASDCTEPAVVALTADLDVRVLVIDRDGAPVFGATVALQQRRGPACFELLTARTEAPTGIARLRHAGHLMRSAAGESFVVALQGLLDPPLERPVDPNLSPSEVLRLVLEPTGSCEVAVVDQSGQRVTGPLEATLRFADTDAGTTPDQLEQQGVTLHSRNGDEVVFEHVELGRPLAVTVIREGSEAPLAAWGPGPRKPGERVVLPVQIDGDLTILRGRLVDRTGAPLGHVSAHARVEAGNPEQPADGAWSLRTDEEGHFSVDSGSWPPDERDIRVLAVYQLSEEGAEVAVARRPLPPVLTAGSHDLGDFVLVKTSLAVAGVVVDGDGNPVADATVTASQADTGSEELTLPPAHSDERGRFEILGELGSESISLVARKDSRVGGPVVARAGERGARLVLGATGGIAGTVLLDPSLLDSMMLVQAARSESASEPDDEPGQKPGVLDRDGHFSIRNLRPGSYRIGVVYAASGSELAWVDGLVVRAGETTRDPRIEPLDLRTGSWLIELQLVDESGEPVPNGRAFSRPSGDTAAQWSYASRNEGKLQLLSAGGPLEVAISATGFLDAALDDVTTSQRVILRRAVPLRFYLARGLRLPEPPLQLGVELTPLAPGRFSGFVDSRLTTFDESGTLTCQSACTGELRVELAVLRRGGLALPPVFLQEESPRIITVADHPFEQPFEIRFDPARLEQAVKEALAER